MKRFFLVSTFLFISFMQLTAQGVEKVQGTSASASQIYFEAGGSGFIYTLNYDSRFKKMENGLGFRVGIGGAGGDGSGYFAIPAQLNYLIGEKGKYLELGAGATYVNVKEDFFFNDETESTVFANLVIGFRSQPFAKKGLTWRLAFTPFIGNGGFAPWAGASIGFRF